MKDFNIEQFFEIPLQDEAKIKDSRVKNHWYHQLEQFHAHELINTDYPNANFERLKKTDVRDFLTHITLEHYFRQSMTDNFASVNILQSHRLLVQLGLHTFLSMSERVFYYKHLHKYRTESKFRTEVSFYFYIHKFLPELAIYCEKIQQGSKNFTAKEILYFIRNKAAIYSFDKPYLLRKIYYNLTMLMLAEYGIPGTHHEFDKKEAVQVETSLHKMFKIAKELKEFKLNRRM